MAPFEQDETFASRKDILDSIDQKLEAVCRRAVVTGIGGVGYDQIVASRPCFGCDSRARRLRPGMNQLKRWAQGC
jgi:hypothetical protein